ncbi:hypothetical protein T07_12611 [Trichinella nelsoni]|uniref:Uncharacterized protein n=1 Tax=Trichinella nelsoni TaxID=6336 RepID=A0A0V0RMY1_9BILA|nr:hypothetical protein T07_12611 [Trichinella nelsoni]
MFFSGLLRAQRSTSSFSKYKSEKEENKAERRNSSRIRFRGCRDGPVRSIFLPPYFTGR